ALSACSGTPDPGAGGSPRPAGGATSPPTGSGSAAPLHVPAGSPGDRTCLEPRGTTVVFDVLRVRAPLTLEGMTVQGSRPPRLVRAWVMPRPPGEVPVSGAELGGVPDELVRRRLGWGGHRPLRGAALSPGAYYFVAALDLRTGERLSSLDLAWRTPAGSGTVPYVSDVRVRRHCT
ncbi:MAG: hypothetical protein ACXVD0_05305, partial [Nocardioides sp.]